MKLFSYKIKVFFKNYWWLPVGVVAFIIFFSIRSSKGMKQIKDLFNSRKEMADKEIEAAKNALEENKRINKEYNEALKKVSEEQKKSASEIKKQYKDKMKESARKNRKDRDAFAKQLAERHGLNEEDS